MGIVKFHLACITSEANQPDKCPVWNKNAEDINFWDFFFLAFLAFFMIWCFYYLTVLGHKLLCGPFWKNKFLMITVWWSTSLTTSMLCLCLTGWRRASQSGVYQGQGPVPPEGAGEGGWKPSGEPNSFHQPLRATAPEQRPICSDTYLRAW